MDATSVSDGKLILIKRVVSNSPELHIATFLSSKELRKDPRNHCVPILDAFVDAQEPAISFIVMPFLRPIDKPEFDTVGSILNCVDQFLEVGDCSARFITTASRLSNRDSFSCTSITLPTGELIVQACETSSDRLLVIAPTTT